MVAITAADIAAILVPAAVAFILVYGLTPIVAQFMLRRGITGVDVHKPSKPTLPEMCGVSIVVGFIVAVFLIPVFAPKAWASVGALAFMVGVAAIVGVVDGFKTLGAKTKVLLTAAPFVPLVVLGPIVPFPEFPFIGELRMTLLYPLVVVPLLVATFSNTTNMIDVFNGAMPASLIIASIFLFAIAFATGRLEVAAAYGVTLGCLIAYHRYNRYPAKVFTGDVGSLALGSLLAGLAVIGRMEIVTLIALLPLLINGALNLASVGRFFERREISERPVVLRNDGSLAATPNRNAPVTLTRFLLAYGPLKEDSIVRYFTVLMVFSGVLAVLMEILILVT